mmetsp:Transcript_41060/g.80295  ORF Transcript_41060/g.80295 Transcript_41060/m.80295 type:complete len:203 (+) Transcript_41060:145-753(+)
MLGPLSGYPQIDAHIPVPCRELRVIVWVHSVLYALYHHVLVAADGLNAHTDVLNAFENDRVARNVNKVRSVVLIASRNLFHSPLYAFYAWPGHIDGRKLGIRRTQKHPFCRVAVKHPPVNLAPLPYFIAQKPLNHCCLCIEVVQALHGSTIHLELSWNLVLELTTPRAVHALNKLLQRVENFALLGANILPYIIIRLFVGLS